MASHQYEPSYVLLKQPFVQMFLNILYIEMVLRQYEPSYVLLADRFVWMLWNILCIEMVFQPYEAWCAKISYISV